MGFAALNPSHASRLREEVATGKPAMDVLMPQLGETVAEGKITQWFKSAGDAIKPALGLLLAGAALVAFPDHALAAGSSYVINQCDAVGGLDAEHTGADRASARSDDHTLGVAEA